MTGRRLSMNQPGADGGAQRRRRQRSVAVGAVLVAVAACAIGLWSARSRAIGDRASGAATAYGAGKWPVAAELARQALAVHKDDPEALRVLARASARLGRDAAATAIYERRLDDKSLEAEDHLMLGLLHHRQGRADAAARDWKKVLDSEEFTASLARRARPSSDRGASVGRCDRGDRATQRAIRLGGAGIHDAGRDTPRAQQCPRRRQFVPPRPRVRPGRDRQIARSDQAPKGDRPHVPANGASPL